jgi:HD-GYP domain-containing protein (c-di-GMP phosphodiesterase class II)
MPQDKPKNVDQSPVPGVEDLLGRIERLNAIGIALSSEDDVERLLETILVGAMELTRADGGTLYAVQGDQLTFRILRNTTLGIAFGGASRIPPPLPPVAMHDADGGPNHHSVVAHAVLAGTTVNVPDAYHAQGFDFSGTRAFDERTGYHSTSLLTVPMRDHEGQISGVLQLLNARRRDGVVGTFTAADQRLVESLASQAATALTKRELIADQQALFESFIRLIADAIDDKSPYTGGHCRRVPELTMLLADACQAAGEGPLADFRMDAKDRYELHIASWLHDCGKITTPEWVMDKATKLSRIHDRIELVAERINATAHAIEAEAWRRVADQGLAGTERLAVLDAAKQRRERLFADLAFLRRCNLGSEAMSPADQERVQAIACSVAPDADGTPRPLLTADEVRNLCIPRGTLLPEEREVINHHIVATLKMLESLPYPRHLRRVPEFAGGHHERMDGKGYPKGLTRAQMSVQARIMGISDVFEALTAGDRPYKKAMTLSQALAILGKMKLDGHIDPDIFDVFIRSDVYRTYAERFLKPEQMDAVDPARIPGWPT